jgi:hypothetical protein
MFVTNPKATKCSFMLLKVLCFISLRISGQGERLKANGGKYVGEWKNGMRNGKGIETDAITGKQTEGFWQNNVLIRRL